jgi:rSAM/selenodomain-associated transferase 1
LATLLIIFAKKPAPGQVKTRLCPPLSPEDAARLYQGFLDDTLAEMERLPELTLALAYAPAGARSFFQDLVPPGVSLFPQEGEDLGERMARAFAWGFDAGCDLVLLRGSDTPDLPGAVVLEAATVLGQGLAQVALGPSLDGGYYLMGLKALHPELFRELAWSGATVLADTLERARRLSLPVHLLPGWRDIDNFRDLAAFLERPHPAPGPGWRSDLLARAFLDERPGTDAGMGRPESLTCLTRGDKELMTDGHATEPVQTLKRASIAKPLIFLGMLLVIITAVRLTHLQDYLEEQYLRQLMASFGIWGPIVYLTIWTLAPSLLLPGLPIMLAGGVLFGPFWGVVYVTLGATTGGSLAFLVARYLAREWVGHKLSGTRLQVLDDKVAQHGWKIVAFTRLVPVFPYFLVNYAFGLTRISLAAFALATFFAMIPLTIAFVYFASHILDLLKGNISPGLIVGVVLVAAVSFIPFVYKKVKARQGESLEL